MSQKLSKSFGGVGIIIMISGLSFLFYDAYRINQLYPVGYRFYDHPDIYVPLVSMFIAFLGTAIFIINFQRGRKIL
ncbi:MAG: hypothetical protein ACRBB2_09215 [Nitrosopumilus sp.]